MIHLDNELLTTERIIKFIEEKIDLLKKPKIGATPSGVVQFQNKLRVSCHNRRVNSFNYP